MKDATGLQPTAVRERGVRRNIKGKFNSVNDLGLVLSVRATGRGIIILAGPSSCGKGGVAKVLQETLHIPEENHLSMGEALREIVARLESEPEFEAALGEQYGVYADRCIYDPAYSSPALIEKAQRYSDDLEARFGPEPSQADWLAFCVTAGLLVPDAWSERIIDGVIADRATRSASPLLLDGYPRTEAAAQHVLGLCDRLSIPIIKVLHLSVSKREMHRRALGRRRQDDTPETLERRYQFYIDHVQPCVELIKSKIGNHRVAIIDAHQPEYHPDGSLDLKASVRNVADAVLIALGVSRHILRSLGSDRELP